MKSEEIKYASRAGLKLEHALSEFKIDVKDQVCADLGCSTGGFVDCLLQNGARKVYAVDTGYGVLDWNLRNDPRVVVMERTNALHVKFPEPINFISIDVSWTKQKLILPVALGLLEDDGQIVSLLKPHYEADESLLKKGRLEDEYLPKVIEDVKNGLAADGIVVKDIIESPILGKKGGNVEYLMWVAKAECDLSKV